MLFTSIFNGFLASYGITSQVLFMSFVLMIPLELYLAGRFRVSKIKFFCFSLLSLYFSYLFGRIFHTFFDATELFGLIKYFDWQGQVRFFLFPYAGGIMFYGSLIGSMIGIAFVYPFLRKNKAAYIRCFDITIICFAFTAIFSRLADFSFSDSFGFPFESPLSLVYPTESAAARQLIKRGILEAGMPTPPLFPTQPIMIVAKIVIFFVLLLKCFKDTKKVPLNYVALFFLMYGPYRFCIDFFRFDRAAYFLGLTTSQWLSIFFFAVALFYYRYLYKKLEQKYCTNGEMK